MSDKNEIFIKNAYVNNLKGIDVRIPRNKFTVITGLSGSGKSSLAFDTLYAEGQRRYVESLSSYARQFLGRMSKPEVDFIKGIPPAIAIQQKVNTHNPRSTVGTSTEVYEYLKLLFARIGKTYSPISGCEVKKHQVSDVVDYVLSFPEGTRGMVLSPFKVSSGRTVKQQLEILQQQGYSRVEVDGNVMRIDEALEDASLDEKKVVLVIDRFSVKNDLDTSNRLADSVQTAFSEGGETCVIRIYSNREEFTEKGFSKKFEADGIVFEEPTELLFSFNTPYGACPTCEGFGKVMGIDEDLVIPDKTKSVYDGAVVCWKGEKMSEWLHYFVMNSSKYKFPIHKPYMELSREEKALLWHGNAHLQGIDAFFDFVKENQYKIQYRVMLARYRGKTTCPDCLGTRLRKEANYVKVAGKTITDLVDMQVSDLALFFNNIELTEHEQNVAKRLLIEIKNRLNLLNNVGLGYLTLNRLSNSLSGGESQRINLVTSLGSSLVGSLYVLDEPSIGLHPKDTHLLIDVLRKLQQIGNTVVVVEHEEQFMRAADYIVDIGPKAGRLGGQVVFQGSLTKDISEDEKLCEESFTLKYLNGTEKIELPPYRRKWNNYIELKGVCHNNLKGINVKFPLNVLSVVTGVSGSGKSSLVYDVLYNALKREFDEVGEKPGSYSELTGSVNMLKRVEFVDQNPIGKSSRSNPVTYVKAYDDIRKLFASQPLAKQMGYGAGHFSFNTDGGRCDECKGEGTVTVEMQFMADLILTCEACQGKRFKSDILEVLYRGKSIYDVLDMTVNQAVEFFSEENGSLEKKINRKLKTLQDVGLGYVKLGQASNTLSGGESQRVKLADILGNEKTEPTLFIFDEPTTGLHFHDVKTLLKALNELVAKGHTVLIVEHDMDVVKTADYVIDIGPDGGDAGGELVFAGTPEELAKCERSHTGRFLKEKLEL
jgi:excinuclease ABC subunit A